MNTTITISCSNPINNTGTTKTTETESLSESSSENETIMNPETSLKESSKKQNKVGLLMKSEFALGLLYLLVGLIIGQKIGQLSVPFAITAVNRWNSKSLLEKIRWFYQSLLTPTYHSISCVLAISASCSLSPRSFNEDLPY